MKEYEEESGDDETIAFWDAMREDDEIDDLELWTMVGHRLDEQEHEEES